MIDWLRFSLCSYSTALLRSVLDELARIVAPLQHLEIEIQGYVVTELAGMIHHTRTIKWLFLGRTDVDLIVGGHLDNHMLHAFQNNGSIIRFEYPHELLSRDTSEEIKLLSFPILVKP